VQTILWKKVIPAREVKGSLCPIKQTISEG